MKRDLSERMLDGASGDSKGIWIRSEEVELVKRLILCDNLYVVIIQASEMTCILQCFTAFFHLNFVLQGGHLLTLIDQLRKKFSQHRPFEGGYEPPREFFMVIYCHVSYPLALLSVRDYLLSCVNSRELT